VVAAISESSPDSKLENVIASIKSEQLVYLFKALSDHAKTIASRDDRLEFLFAVLSHADRLPKREFGFFVERPELSVAQLFMRVLEQFEDIERRRLFWRSIVERAPANLVPWLAAMPLT
jgi:hypothetical protein